MLSSTSTMPWETTTLLIGNIHCPSCISTITDVLSSLSVYLSPSNSWGAPFSSSKRRTPSSSSSILAKLTDSQEDQILVKIPYESINVSILSGLVSFRPNPYSSRSSPAPTATFQNPSLHSHSDSASAHEFPSNLQYQTFIKRVKETLFEAGFNVLSPTDSIEEENEHGREDMRSWTSQLLFFPTSRKQKRGKNKIRSPQSKNGNEKSLQETAEVDELYEAKKKAHIQNCKACQSQEKEQQVPTSLPKDTSRRDSDVKSIQQVKIQRRTESRFLIEGMTCSSCVSSINAILEPGNMEGLFSAYTTLLPPQCIVTHDVSQLGLEKLTEAIEDGGFGATLISSKENFPQGAGEDLSNRKREKMKVENHIREVNLKIEGFFCNNCSDAVNSLFAKLKDSGALLSYLPVSVAKPNTIISYQPNVPVGFTLRSLQGSISGLGPFTIHPIQASSNLTELARRAETRQRNQILVLLAFTFIFSIPTFLIAIIFMSLLPSTSHLRQFLEKPIWGNASRGTMSLFILVTPIQFGVGQYFYRRAWKSLRGVWVRNGVGKWKERMWRWGSMDTLVALGTTAGWTASLCYMILDVTSKENVASMAPTTIHFEADNSSNTTSSMSSTGTGEMGYFDSSVFLMLFILLGRYLEGLSRKQTGEAMDALGNMKDQTGQLYHGRLDQNALDHDTKDERSDEKIGPSEGSSNDNSDQPSPSKNNLLENKSQGNVETVEVPFLEKGDLILIPSGSSVPLDSVIVSLGSEESPNKISNQSNFDESSLTGESQPSLKSPGDMIFTGSTNLGPSAIIAKVETPAGDTMLDGIVSAVSDAMARKASLERLANQITGYFVPLIVFISIFTFTVWVIRGYTGSLPAEWLYSGTSTANRGGWALFAVQFSVAVLVVACPCGIGLAAPTAQMVGTGLAARLGIVPYGGGEAFQNAANIDAVVFDKTGTCTMGEFVVSDHRIFGESRTLEKQGDKSDLTLVNIVLTVEETSSHPISKGMTTFCRSRTVKDGHISPTVVLLSAEEIPGKGLKAKIQIESHTCDIIIGNLAHIQDCSVDLSQSVDPNLEDPLSVAKSWGLSGKTTVFVAIRGYETKPLGNTSPYCLMAMFALQDLPRPETAFVVGELERQGIPVYMCTGDSLTPALAIADAVGIKHDCVHAEVLPLGKQDFVAKLQNGGAAERIMELHNGRKTWRRLFLLSKRKSKANILFVGDGINDIVAMNEATVGVSMGTGASITLGSSDFCLLSSNLTSLLTLISLARATTNKIKFNFGWAIVFNAILIPIAAGTFYSIGRTRLPPVWAALAMALSSISVVLSSLSLRYTFTVPKSVQNYKAARRET